MEGQWLSGRFADGENMEMTRRNTSLRIILPIVAAVVPVLFCGAPVLAFGMEAQRIVVRRTVEALPDPLRSFLTAHLDGVMERTVEPDGAWRRNPRFRSRKQWHYLELDAAAAGALIAVLDESKLRGEAIRALASSDDPQVPQAILKRYAELSDAEKRDAVSTLAGRLRSANELLSAVERGRVARTDLHAFHIQQMLQLENDDLLDRIEEVWGVVRETSADKQRQIAGFKQHLTRNVILRADIGRGRMVFSKTCASCHRLFGAGERIAPDLTGSNRTNLDYVLQNVIDPSAVDRKSTRLNSSHTDISRMPSSA